MNATLAERSPAVATRLVGALGTVAGLIGMIALMTPSPTELTARNLAGYVVPLVRPVITTGE